MKTIKTQTATQRYNNLHIPTREEFHKHFGGVIHQSDFNTDYRGTDHTNGSTIAARIESDFRWEQKLKNVYKIEMR